MPSTPTQNFRSTRNQSCNCTPIIATVRLYRVDKLDVLVFCPCTRTSSRPVDVGIQDNHPSAPTLGPRGRVCGRLASELRYCCTAGNLLSYWRRRFHWSPSQVALLDTIGTQKALSKLSPDAKRRIKKLRCVWLPVNRRVSREDPDRQNGCKSCSPGNLVEETVDHILQFPHQLRRDAVHDRFAGMTKTFRSWKTSHLIIDAYRAGTLAWIDGNPAPAVGTLHLPDSPLGQLVYRA
jgi:hypothetical protein